MRIIQKMRNVSREEYYETHLAVINPMLPVRLTDTERRVLAMFMIEQVDHVMLNPFSPEGRERVMAKLGMNKTALSNHISSLVRKGFLRRREERGFIEIHSFVIPEPNGQGYQFKLQWYGDQSGGAEA